MTQRSQPSSQIDIKLPDLPDKLYFKIREVSALTDLPAHVLRFWENQFPKLRPKRSGTAQRLYRPADIHLILTIKALLYTKKFTIQGANQYLRDHPADLHALKQKALPLTPPETDHQKALRQVRDELRKIRKLLG